MSIIVCKVFDLQVTSSVRSQVIAIYFNWMSLLAFLQDPDTGDLMIRNGMDYH
jgi:hypothetical protein